MKAFLSFSFLLGVAFAGNTYPIAEPDLLEEVLQRRAIVERKLRESMKNVRIKAPDGWERKLPLASKSRTYRIEPKAVLDKDIPRVDQQGRVIGILYPKGYTFNPLPYLPADPPVLIVFDATDQRQVRYVKETLLKQYPYRMLIIGRGDYSKTLEVFGESVYFLHPKLRETFNLTEGVSVVRWDRKRGIAIVEVHGCDKVGYCNSVSGKR